MATMGMTGTFATPYPTWESPPFLTCGGTGTYKTGEVVTCNPGYLHAAPGVLSYAWYLDGVTLKGGQTAATYTLVAGDLTHRVSCLVTHTPTDTNYVAGSKMSGLSPVSIP